MAYKPEFKVQLDMEADGSTSPWRVYEGNVTIAECLDMEDAIRIAAAMEHYRNTVEINVGH